MYFFNKINKFKQICYKNVEEQLNLEWKLYTVKRKLNIKYKIMMVLFLAVIIGAYGWVHNEYKNGVS